VRIEHELPRLDPLGHEVRDSAIVSKEAAMKEHEQLPVAMLAEIFGEPLRGEFLGE